MNKSSRVGRREQLSQQEKLIEQRKREIENKLKHSSIETTNSELKNEPAIEPSGDNKQEFNDDNEDNKSKAISPTNTEEKVSPNEVNPIVNKFKNDGSFFAQFLQMQKSDEQSSDSNTSNTDTNVSDNQQTKPVIKPIKMIVKENKSKLKAVNSVDESNVRLCDDDDDNKVFPPEDKHIQSAIERTAISVAMNGIEAEETMRRTKAEDNSYSWLSIKDSLHYQYFQKRVQQLSEAKKRAQNYSFDSNEDNKEIESIDSNSNSSKGTKRERKSRWSDEKVDVKIDAVLVQYAIQVFGSTDLSPEQWKQLEDQRKMKMLCQMIEKKQSALKMMANSGKVQYEYDSDEDTTDGTWEHKRRRQEMSKTHQIAQQLTESGSGKHHIGDFMPPEELEKFIQKWDALKEGTPNSPESDYKDSKLQSDNVGFQMLKKLGWVEGQGLGADSSGISEPINKSVGASNNSGLGQIRPEDLKEGDDEYEAYRKRMMLAYRFRPNPMNNPRRSYY